MQREQSNSHPPPPPPPEGWKNYRHMKATGKSQSLAAAAAAALPSTRAVVILSTVLLFVGAAVSVPWINNSLCYSSVVKDASNPISLARWIFGCVMASGDLTE